MVVVNQAASNGLPTTDSGSSTTTTRRPTTVLPGVACRTSLPDQPVFAVLFIIDIILPTCYSIRPAASFIMGLRRSRTWQMHLAACLVIHELRPLHANCAEDQAEILEAVRTARVTI